MPSPPLPPQSMGEGQRARTPKPPPRRCRLIRLSERSGIQAKNPSRLSLGEGMDPAFQFLAAPASGSRIVRIFWYGRTRLAAIAEITSVVMRQVAKRILVGVFPHLPQSPVGLQADFHDSLSIC